MKKDGGLICNWKLHYSGLSEKCHDLLKLRHPDISFDPAPAYFTGTVVEDSAGRFQPGVLISSSFIISVDRKKGIIETQNTIYKVILERGDDD